MQSASIHQALAGLITHSANVISIISIAIATYLIKIWFQSLKTNYETLDTKVDRLESRMVALETEVELTRKGA